VQERIGGFRPASTRRATVQAFSIFHSNFNVFVFALYDQERFPQSGIVSVTGRHPPPPRVAGPAEAQLAFAVRCASLFAGHLFCRAEVNIATDRATSKFESYACHSGRRALAREPGMHNHRSRAMDSGFAAFGGAPE
jgi:hypothetical protein